MPCGDYFSQMLDIPVVVPNPFDNLVMKDESLRPLGPRFSVAIGLGEEGFMKETINLFAG